MTKIVMIAAMIAATVLAGLAAGKTAVASVDATATPLSARMAKAGA